MSESESPDAGVSASWKRLAETGGELLQSRLELLSIELAEERERLQRAVLLAAVAMLFGLLALGCLSALIVIVFWPLGHWQALTALVVVDFAVVAYCGLRLRGLFVDGPRPFAATRAELARDRAYWQAR